jgi:CO/xanthine dehydrogenase Mo-binding subunit
MLVQDALGIPIDKVTVIHGDTDLVPFGIGTYASRSLQLGGIAVHRAALDVKDQARQLAASLLEASEADLELDTERGLWHVRGDPASGRTWAEVARHAGADGLAARAGRRHRERRARPDITGIHLGVRPQHGDTPVRGTVHDRPVERGRATVAPGCTMKQGHADQISAGIAAVSIGAMTRSGPWRRTASRITSSPSASSTATS